MELLARYLERTERTCTRSCARATRARRQPRLQHTLRCLFGPGHPYGERVVAVRGRPHAPGLGLRARGLDALAERVERGRPRRRRRCRSRLALAGARAINVDGTRRMLEFAERCQARGGLRRFTYISTAYVAGEHAGCFSEDDLDVGQRFHNAYEQLEVRGRVPASPAGAGGCRSRCCARASSSASATAAGRLRSTCIYWPLRAFARGAYVAAAGARLGAPVDVVPVDYVADAIFALSQCAEAEGATFHLTAGRHVSSVGELVELASDVLRPPRRRA